MIPEELLRLKVSSRSELIINLYESLNESIVRVIDTHNTSSIIFVYNDGGDSFLLKAEFGAKTATHKEIEWYERVKSLQLRQTIKFLDSYANKTYALLLLEYINNSATVDELVLSSDVSEDLLSSYISKAFAVDQKLFNESSFAVDYTYADIFFGKKYNDRRNESRAIPYLSELFANDTIIINNKEYATPDAAMRYIQADPSLLKMLTPNRLGLIHGDLHCGNILTKEEEVFLIDPNGNFTMPLEYDVGKILHSIHGNYGAIMRGAYSLEKETSSSFNFVIDASQKYEMALQNLTMSLSDSEYLRGLYAEALHFATMLPHHASNKDETTALFLQSVLIFNELKTKITI